MEFEKGDFVRFKAGSPIMLVTKTYENDGYNGVQCQWFTSNGEPMGESFHSDRLDKVEKREAIKIINKTNDKFDSTFDFIDLEE